MTITRSQILARGAKGRCPNCGEASLFAHGLTLHKACPKCGLEFERGEGFFLGSMSINYGVTIIAYLVPVLILYLAGVLPAGAGLDAAGAINLAVSGGLEGMIASAANAAQAAVTAGVNAAEAVNSAAEQAAAAMGAAGFEGASKALTDVLNQQMGEVRTEGEKAKNVIASAKEKMTAVAKEATDTVTQAAQAIGE